MKNRSLNSNQLMGQNKFTNVMINLKDHKKSRFSASLETNSVKDKDKDKDNNDFICSSFIEDKDNNKQKLNDESLFQNEIYELNELKLLHKRKRLSLSRESSSTDIPGKDPIKKLNLNNDPLFFNQIIDQSLFTKNLYLTKEFQNIQYRLDINCPDKVECIISLGDLAFAMATQTKLIYFTLAISNSIENHCVFDSTLSSNPITYITSSKVMVKQHGKEDIKIENHYLACGYQNSKIKIFSIPKGNIISDLSYFSHIPNPTHNISISYLLIVNNNLLICTGYDGALVFFNLSTKNFIRKFKTSHDGIINVIFLGEVLNQKPYEADIITGGEDGRIIKFRLKHEESGSWDKIDFKFEYTLLVHESVICINRSIKSHLKNILLVGTTNKLLKIRIDKKCFIKQTEEKFDDEKIIDIIIIDYQNDENGLALLFKNGINNVIKYKFNSEEGSCLGETECLLNNVSLSKGPRIQCFKIHGAVIDNSGSVMIAVINNYNENNENQKKQGAIVFYDIKMVENN